MAKIPTLEQMLNAGMHFGHRTSKWHPKMEPFIFTKRNNIHIIDLSKTQKHLENAIEFMKKMISEEKVILFVGTKSQVKAGLKEMAIEIKQPYVAEKWIGGILTNFLIIKKLTRKYVSLLEQKESGKLARYTKKEQLDITREIEKLELRVGGLANMHKLPDVMFVWDAKKEKNAIEEAKKKNIPIVAVCDTNVNPEGIKYVIASNDDATKTIKLLLDTIKENLKEAKTQPKPAAEKKD